MAKKDQKTPFALTSPVWKGAEKLPVGTVVTFDGDEPTGVYKGRCKPVGEAVAVAAPDNTALDAAKAEAADAVKRAEVAEAERDQLKAEVAELKKTPPTPPKP